MASGLSFRHLPPDPARGEYEHQQDGMEPEVQLIGPGTEERKLAPNYSDWLYAKQEARA